MPTVKMSASVVLASLKASTYSEEYASAYRSLRLAERPF